MAVSYFMCDLEFFFYNLIHGIIHIISNDNSFTKREQSWEQNYITSVYQILTPPALSMDLVSCDIHHPCLSAVSGRTVDRTTVDRTTVDLFCMNSPACIPQYCDECRFRIRNDIESRWLCISTSRSYLCTMASLTYRVPNKYSYFRIFILFIWKL